MSLLCLTSFVPRMNHIVGMWTDHAVSMNMIGVKLVAVVTGAVVLPWDFVLAYCRSYVASDSISVVLSPGVYVQPSFTAQLTYHGHIYQSAVVTRREVLWLSATQSLPHGHIHWVPTTDTGVGFVVFGRLCGKLSSNATHCTPLASRFYTQPLNDAILASIP